MSLNSKSNSSSSPTSTESTVSVASVWFGTAFSKFKTILLSSTTVTEATLTSSPFSSSKVKFPVLVNSSESKSPEISTSTCLRLFALSVYIYKH
ncbi:hypothetical protein [Tenuibacillus multivorans]|uniref:hypothetical protein n=1 Tax=Tenuibacillus multivorans TaxID=237069 RepID=UPI00115FDB13|nr:hypothetical protein [Tenuibacillus multivorans]